MKKVLIATTLLLLSAAVASAQASRTWVSGVGDDANPCSRTAPCKTFAGAISKTAAGGEIDTIDSAGFGAVTITKSITINGTGNLASILAAGTNGIIINAAATDTVVIRNLKLTRGGQSGIYCTVGHLIVENCVISGFSSYGIWADCKQLIVKDTTVRNCNYGVYTISSWQFFNVTTVDRCRFEKNTWSGLTAYYNSRVVVRDSVATGNTYGFQAKSFNGYTTEMHIENSLANYNGSGVLVDNSSGGSASIRVSNTTSTSNGIGFHIVANGTILSRGNNTVRGNTIVDVVGTITTISGT